MDSDDEDMEMPLLKLIERASTDLSKKQLDIFTNIDFKLPLTAIVAGAGAGKTRTLSPLLIRLL